MYADISTASAMRALAQNPRIKLVDVRSPKEFQSGHIAKSINIPSETIGQITRQVSDLHTTIFVYCKSGQRADEAKTQLEQMGYTQVVNIGSIYGWPLVTD